MAKSSTLTFYDPSELVGNPFNLRMNEIMERKVSDREMKATELFRSIKIRSAIDDPVFVEIDENGVVSNLTGERRKQCARLLGLPVPAIVKKFKTEPERRAFILDNNRDDLRENWKADTTTQIWRIFSPEDYPLIYADLSPRGPQYIYDLLGFDSETATPQQRTKVYQARYELLREQESERKRVVNFFRKREMKLEMSTLVRKHIAKIRKLEYGSEEKRRPAGLSDEAKRQAIINEVQYSALETYHEQYMREYKEARAKLLARRRSYDPDRIQRIMKSEFAPEIAPAEVKEEGLHFKILSVAIDAKERIEAGQEKKPKK